MLTFAEDIPLRLKYDPLNTELNPNFRLLALLVAHHILHVSWINVKIKYVLRLIQLFLYFTLSNAGY